jgi:hypothetical protein
MKEIVTVDKDGNVISRTVEKPKTSGFAKFVTLVGALFILSIVVAGIEHPAPTDNSTHVSTPEQTNESAAAAPPVSAPASSYKTVLSDIDKLSAELSAKPHKLSMCLRHRAEMFGSMSEGDAISYIEGGECAPIAEEYCSDQTSHIAMLNNIDPIAYCNLTLYQMATSIWAANFASPHDGNKINELATCAKEQMDTGHYTYKDMGKSQGTLEAACKDEIEALKGAMNCRSIPCALAVSVGVSAILFAYDPSNPKVQAQAEPETTTDPTVSKPTPSIEPTEPVDLSTVTPSNDSELNNTIQAALSNGVDQDWTAPTANESGRVYVGQPQTYGDGRTCRSYGYTVSDGTRAWKAPLEYACRASSAGDWTLNAQL